MPGPRLRADITWSMADRQWAPEPRAGVWRAHQGREETGFAGGGSWALGSHCSVPSAHSSQPCLLISPRPPSLCQGVRGGGWGAVRQLRPCLGRKGADALDRVPLSRSGFPASGVSSFSPSNPVGLSQTGARPCLVLRPLGSQRRLSADPLLLSPLGPYTPSWLLAFLGTRAGEGSLLLPLSQRQLMLMHLPLLQVN